MIFYFNPRYNTLHVAPVTLDDPRKDLVLGIKEFLDSEGLSSDFRFLKYKYCIEQYIRSSSDSV